MIDNCGVNREGSRVENFGARSRGKLLKIQLALKGVAEAKHPLEKLLQLVNSDDKEVKTGINEDELRNHLNAIKCGLEELAGMAKGIAARISELAPTSLNIAQDVEEILKRDASEEVIFRPEIRKSLAGRGYRNSEIDAVCEGFVKAGKAIRGPDGGYRWKRRKTEL